MKKILLTLLLIALSSHSIAASDSGIISEIYFDSASNVAVKLEGGFPNAVAESTCPSNNGWAGAVAPEPALVSALLAAKVSKSNVSLSLSGCDAGGAWIKLNAIYIK